MNKRREDLFISDIVKYCDAISLAVQKGESVFQQDILLRLGIEKSIENIGEAAKHISEETRSMAPNIPWRQIAGMRDMLTHCYFESDPFEVWKTATVDIPALRLALTPLLEKRIQSTQRPEDSYGMGM